MRFESIISEMTSIFYWASLFEIWLFCIAFVIFCFHPVQMAIIWAYVLHVLKGCFGIVMTFLFAPTTTDMIDSMSEFPDKDACMTFDELGNHINRNFKDYLKG